MRKSIIRTFLTVIIGILVTSFNLHAANDFSISDTKLEIDTINSIVAVITGTFTAAYLFLQIKKIYRELLKSKKDAGN